MSKILQLAFSELGVTETPGSQHTDRILQYAKEAGITGINDDETPWCSIFTNWVSHKLGLQKSGKPNARSWVSVGTPTTDPQPGDVVVFWRNSINSWEGHVAFFLGYSPNLSKVYCIGGNQGNAVSVGAYDSAKVLQFRKIAKADDNLQAPEPVLQNGSRGGEVEKLQRALNHLGYNCGDADGAFGNKTYNALKLLQANNRLTVDGIYTQACKNVLESLLQS